MFFVPDVMNKTYVIALDQGTTSSRSIVFDRGGNVKAVAAMEFPQQYPRPGWVEHDPYDIWASQSATLTEVMGKGNLSRRQIAAIGVTNQRETTIVWDRKTGEPVYPAIVWQDRRTAAFCESLRQEGVEPLFASKTGLRLDPYFSGTKLRWILDHVEGVRKRAERGELAFGTVDSWLVWKLTGGSVHVTDVSNASRTLLLNIHTGEWDDELLEILGIPRPLLPEVKSCSEVYGEVGEDLHPSGIPIAGMAGDQQAALFGQACFNPGMAKNTYGTGCFLLMQTGEKAIPSENNLLTTVAWKIGGRTEYALEGSIFIGGAVVQWLRDELQMIRAAEECDQLAATVNDAGGLFIVPAFAGLGAPYWDPYARGLCVGITRGTSRAHFCRAALEGIAFQCHDLIVSMEKDSGITLRELRVDGGASRSEPLLQFQSDLLQVPVIRPQCVQSTALGAASLAGLAVGFWENREEMERNRQIDRTFSPQGDVSRLARLKQGWQRAVERSRGWEDCTKFGGK